MPEKNGMLRLGLVLFLITALSGILLGFAYEGTKDIIAEKKEAVNQAAYMSVLPGASNLNPVEIPDGASESVIEAYEDEKAGYALKVEGTGYGGTIEIALGISREGTLCAISIISSSETAGLGQRASDPSFKDQFQGKAASGDLTVTKQAASSENEIEAISGATITSRAVTSAVNEGIQFYNQYLKEGE